MKKMILMLMAMVVFGNVLGQIGTFTKAVNISATSGTFAFGKVRMLYIQPSSSHTYSVVAIESANGTAPLIEGNNVSLGANTKTYGYFAFDNSDKHILATLLSAKANGLNVCFGISSTTLESGSINKITAVLAQ